MTATDRSRNEKLAQQIVEHMDFARFDSQGGYPSVFVIRGEEIILASVDHEGAPTLTIQTVAAFVQDNQEWLDQSP